MASGRLTLLAAGADSRLRAAVAFAPAAMSWGTSELGDEVVAFLDRYVAAGRRTARASPGGGR